MRNECNPQNITNKGKEDTGQKEAWKSLLRPIRIGRQRCRYIDQVPLPNVRLLHEVDRKV